MLVYTDLLSGDELLSDAFSLKQVMDADGTPVEGLMYCESKMVQKGGDAVDIGCGGAFGGDDPDAGADDTVETVNNVIDRFGYTETQIGSASDFKGWIKDYMNAIRQKKRDAGVDKEKIKEFMACAPKIATYFLKRFSDVQFYLGPSFSPESMVFSIYEDGDTTPRFYYIMDGMVANKF
jgi:hypothetical protein